MTENKKKFIEILKDNSYGIYPAPTDAQLAVGVLCDYLLGEDWYIADPIGVKQVNTEIVDEILRAYSPKYNWDVYKEKKRLKKRGHRK